MTEVYLICEILDLGYTVVEAYADEEIAKEVVKSKNIDAREQWDKELMSTGIYTKEQAENYYPQRTFFLLETTELK